MKNFYLLLSLLFPFSLFAQSNYQSGFVLKNNGDTLKGFINYREWTFSPRSIDFKTNKDDKQPIQFNPQTIKCFQVSGAETYVSYTGLVTMNRTEINEISNGLDTTKKSDTLFIKQVASGNNLRLFYEHDDIKTRFFIAGLNEKPTELKNFVSYNSGELANSPIYKGQLVLYVNKFKPRDEKY